MDWLTFTAEVIKAIAWPATVIVAVIIFRGSLTSLIPRIERFKHKDTEIDFAKRVEELQKEAPTSIESTLLAPPEKEEFETEKEELLRLADISPRSAIIEVFRLLESAAAQTVIRHYPDFETRRGLSTVHIADLLRKKEIFNQDDWSFFNDIRQIRNQAAHADDFAFPSKAVQIYIDIALSLAHALRKK